VSLRDLPSPVTDVEATVAAVSSRGAELEQEAVDVSAPHAATGGDPPVAVVPIDRGRSGVPSR
jgi:hypothetical protein